MSSTFRLFAVAACAVLIISVAVAYHVTGSSTGLASSTNTITFDQRGDLVDHVLVTNQYAGASFSGFGWDNGDLGQAGSTGFSGGNLVNGFFGWPTDTTMSITFPTVVNAAAFAAVDQGRQFTFTAYLNGTQVDSMTLPVDKYPGAGFIGFSNENFSMITITRHDPADLSAISIDTLQYITGAIDTGGGTGNPPPNDPPPGDGGIGGPGSVPVPEPASLLLLCSGIGAMAALLRAGRRK
jgi:hypothetical protein